MHQLKDNIDLHRYTKSEAGKLVDRLIAEGMLDPDDLNNPDIVTLINDSEPFPLSSIFRGDEVIIIDADNPRAMIRAKVTYKGKFQTLGYNDKTLVYVEGISISGRRSFAGHIGRAFQRILPTQLNIIDLNPHEQIFRIINEEIETIPELNLVPES